MKFSLTFLALLAYSSSRKIQDIFFAQSNYTGTEGLVGVTYTKTTETETLSLILNQSELAQDLSALLSEVKSNKLEKKPKENDKDQQQVLGNLIKEDMNKSPANVKEDPKKKQRSEHISRASDRKESKTNTPTPNINWDDYQETYAHEVRQDKPRVRHNRRHKNH